MSAFSVFDGVDDLFLVDALARRPVGVVERTPGFRFHGVENTHGSDTGESRRKPFQQARARAMLALPDENTASYQRRSPAFGSFRGELEHCMTVADHETCFLRPPKTKLKPLSSGLIPGENPATPERERGNATSNFRETVRGPGPRRASPCFFAARGIWRP